MSVYVVSDIHAHFELFKAAIPNDYKKLIILGDAFNKGYENREMFLWLIKNVDTNKLIHVIGNHEVMLISQIGEYFKKYINSHNKYDIYRICMLLTKNENNNNYRDKMFNITKNVIAMVNAGVLDFEEITEYFNKLKFYHVEEVSNTKWYLSHAAWIPFKDEISKSNIQDLKKIIYDYNNEFIKGILNGDGKISAYAKECQIKNRKHVFGHWPIKRIDKNAEWPLVFFDVFYYIDLDVRANKEVKFFKLF